MAGRFCPKNGRTILKIIEEKKERFTCFQYKYLAVNLTLTTDQYCQGSWHYEQHV